MIRTVKRLFPITFILCTITFAIGQYTPPTPPVPAELNDILSDSTNWWVQSSWHFQVHGRPLSAVYQDFNLITDSLEKSLTQVCKELKIRDAGLIQWYGFPGPVDSNGSIAKSYPEFGVVLTTYTDSLKNFATKQMIQVLLRRSWGAPQCVFMSEGLATALEGAFGRGKHWRQVQETIRQLSAQNRIPSIADLTRNFQNYPEIQSYSVAGSFLGFLLQRFGPAPIRGLYILAGSNDFQDMFEKIYGHRLPDVEQEWRQTIK